MNSIFLHADCIRFVREQLGTGLMESKKKVEITLLKDHGTLEEKVDFLLGRHLEGGFFQERLRDSLAHYALEVWEDGPWTPHSDLARRFTRRDAYFLADLLKPVERLLVSQVADLEYCLSRLKLGKADLYLGDPAA